MADYTKQVKKILDEHGCYFVRQGGKGSHEVWYSPITKENFAITARIKIRYSANEMLKDAGIKKKV